MFTNYYTYSSQNFNLLSTLVRHRVNSATAGQIFDSCSSYSVIHIQKYLTSYLPVTVDVWYICQDLFCGSIYIDDRKKQPKTNELQYCIVDLSTGEQHDHFIIRFHTDQEFVQITWYWALLGIVLKGQEKHYLWMMF